MKQYEYLFEEKEVEIEDPGDAGEKETDDTVATDGTGPAAEKEEEEELL